MHLPFCSLLLLLLLSPLVNCFIAPVFKSVGCWFLKGTSSTKFEKYQRIQLNIVPIKHTRDLRIHWIQEKDLGPLVYKNVIAGEILQAHCDDEGCSALCTFQAKTHSVELINLFGVVLPTVPLQQPVQEEHNVDDIAWDVDNEILFIEMACEYYIFVRKPISNNRENIRMNQFIISQLLAYLFVKAVDHLNLLN